MRSRARLRRATTSCGAGRSTTSRLLGVDLGVLRGRRVEAVRAACSAGARCRARSGSPGAELSYAEHVFRGHADDAVAIVHASELRPLAETTWGELRALTGGDRGRPAGARRRAAATASSPTCRTSPRRSPRSSPARRSARSGRQLLAGLRRAQRRRPLRADRAEGAARRRRLPLRRQGLRPARRRRAAAGARSRRSSARSCCRTSAREGNWDELLRAGASSSSSSCRSTTRSGCSTRRARPGLPKAIVHGQGGILLEHLKKLHLHLDARPATGSSGSRRPAG